MKLSWLSIQFGFSLLKYDIEISFTPSWRWRKTDSPERGMFILEFGPFSFSAINCIKLQEYFALNDNWSGEE